MHLAPRERLSYDTITFNTAMAANTEDARWELGLTVMTTALKSHLELTQITCNTAMHVCVDGQLWKEALGFAVDTEQRSLKCDVVGYSTAASACQEALHWDWSYQLFQKMRWQRVEPSVLMCNALVQACER